MNFSSICVDLRCLNWNQEFFFYRIWDRKCIWRESKKQSVGSKLRADTQHSLDMNEIIEMEMLILSLNKWWFRSIFMPTILFPRPKEHLFSFFFLPFGVILVTLFLLPKKKLYHELSSLYLSVNFLILSLSCDIFFSFFLYIKRLTWKLCISFVVGWLHLV